MLPGLTLVVGPPGTGKTDVTVQMISNLYHNNPREKILVVTHTNQALNDIFDKISRLDIDERHLVRVGIGEKYLEASKQSLAAGGNRFGKYGRVNHMLTRRLQLLAEVQKLNYSLTERDDTFTCETAQIFYQ